VVLAAFQTHAIAGERIAPPSPTCDGWLKRTLKAVESSSIPRHRDIVVSAVARACAAVPESLRTAAAGYAKASSEQARARTLADGAATVLKDTCPTSDPLATAESLVAACPLPGPGEKAHPAVLGRMRAADYLFLNALMTSLIAAHAYSPTAYRIVLEFIISSAQLSEDGKGKNRQ
jgi:hypothetical protein